MKRDVKRGKVTATSLERALLIMEFAARKPGGISNADIHRQLGAPRSTCSYILGRLEEAGYLRRSAYSKRYGLGLKILTLAHGALRDLGLRVIAEPTLYKLSQETGFSGLIGVLQQGKVLIIDKVDQPGLAEIDFELGVTLPAYATGLGKMLLASLSPDELASFFSSQTLTMKSLRTIDSQERLLQDLDAARIRGYAISDGELFNGVRGIAAPIRDAEEKVCAALSLAGRGVPLNRPELIESVKKAAEVISRRLAKASLSGRSIDADLHALSNIARL